MLTMGERIAKMRERRGLTASALAKRAHIPLSTLSVVERGIRKGEGLTVATAKRLAEALGVTLDYLAGVYEDEEEEAPGAFCGEPACEAPCTGTLLAGSRSHRRVTGTRGPS